MRSFEEIYEELRGIPTPSTDSNRRVRWLGQGRVLGVARGKDGGYELFLLGAALEPESPLVRRHMQHDEWRAESGDNFSANRILLPPQDHYLPMAALLAEELLRNGVEHSVSEGFSASEPLVELTLRRTALEESTVLGLLGEIRFLEFLLLHAPTARARARALDCWRGHQRNASDFVLGNIRIEVKATGSPQSRHQISSLSQVDPRRSADGRPMEQLYLLSMGFATATSDETGTFTLPNRVEAVISLLRPEGSQERGELEEVLLAKVEQYGGDPTRGYRHESMSSWSPYQTRYRQSFIRLYDMNDDAIAVLRRASVNDTWIDEDSVRFRLALPDRITGDLNPETDINVAIRRLLPALG